MGQGAEDYVDVRSFGGERELTTTNVDAKTYPVVIRLECVSSDAEANHGKTLADLPENPIGGLAKPEPWVQCQTTYAEFRRETSAPRKWTAHVTKQKSTSTVRRTSYKRFTASRVATTSG